MGKYFFKADVLEDALITDALDPESNNDFGHNIIPRLVSEGADVESMIFLENRIHGDPENAAPYWRDVGTVDSYFQANMELRSSLPNLNLYNRDWRIRTSQRDYPPARFIRQGDHQGPVEIVDSLICEGSIIAGELLKKSLIGYDCFLHTGAIVEESILLSGCDIGERCKIKRVLMDKNCRIAPGAVIGHDVEADRQRFPFVTESGIVVLPKGTYVPASGPIDLPTIWPSCYERTPSQKPKCLNIVTATL